MTAAPDVAAIAAKLTKAQRQALIAMPEIGWVRSKEIGASGSTMCSLWDRWTGEYGLSNYHSLVNRDVCDRPLGYIWELSELGLAVRKHLLKEQDNGNA